MPQKKAAAEQLRTTDLPDQQAPMSGAYLCVRDRVCIQLALFRKFLLSKARLVHLGGVSLLPLQAYPRALCGIANEF